MNNVLFLFFLFVIFRVSDDSVQPKQMNNNSLHLSVNHKEKSQNRFGFGSLNKGFATRNISSTEFDDDNDNDINDLDIRNAQISYPPYPYPSPNPVISQNNSNETDSKSESINNDQPNDKHDKHDKNDHHHHHNGLSDISHKVNKFFSKHSKKKKIKTNPMALSLTLILNHQQQHIDPF